MPERHIPPVERIVQAANRLADEWHLNLSEDQANGAERALRRLASQLLREAFNDGVNSCGVKDGELTITAYGSRLRKHTTLRRREASQTEGRND